MKNNIAELRKKNGLTMAALAELCRTSQQQIDRLEKSQRKLSAEWIDVLCKALHCQPTDLVRFDSETNSKTVKAKIIGALEPKFSNFVREFVADEIYEISFKPRKESAETNYFGLVVEGTKYKNYPEGTELIFAEKSVKPLTNKLAENEAKYIAKSANKNIHQFQIGKCIVQAELIKSLRNE